MGPDSVLLEGVKLSRNFPVATFFYPGKRRKREGLFFVVGFYVLFSSVEKKGIKYACLERHM